MPTLATSRRRIRMGGPHSFGISDDQHFDLA
jgi:hypothetical protein